jgi:hypothetical protein
VVFLKLRLEQLHQITNIASFLNNVSIHAKHPGE